MPKNDKDCFGNLQITDVCLKYVKQIILGSGLIENWVLLCPNHLKTTLSQIWRELVSFDDETLSKLNFLSTPCFKSSNSYGDKCCSKIFFRSFSNFVLKWLEN